jgi:hypothetical protein
MTKEELYEKLEIETPGNLIYFEQMADLIDCEESIPLDFLYEVLSALDSETAGDFIENYFEELSNALPDNENDMASLLEFIKQKLLMSTQNLEGRRAETDFAEQLYNFRTWYHNPDGALLDGLPSSIFNAITEMRVQNLGLCSHRYDLSPSLDYDLDDVSFNLGEFSRIDIPDENNYGSDC